VIVEPVQGEGGVFPATREFMRALQASVTDAKALLIVDEVQCGLGRTGRLWAHEAYETLKPDMMTLAKPLAGGLPIGAVMVTDAVSQCILPGDHGTTYGGNPFVTSVAQTVFRKIADPAFLAASRERGRQLVSGLKALQSKYPKIITLVRGSLDEGLFVGMEIAVPPKPITQAAADKGLLIITAGDNVLRFCPALNIGAADIDFGLRVLDECLAATAPPA
jgi:acetylornithine/succinyldiaminopimelate/putrescine aminotransferase